MVSFSNVPDGANGERKSRVRRAVNGIDIALDSSSVSAFRSTRSASVSDVASNSGR
jgi:hypothetical protein